MNETDLFKDDREDLDEEWHEAFDTLTGQGNSPTGIKAAIEYVSTEKTQSDVAEEFGVSEPTIRNLQEAVLALGAIDGQVPATSNTSKMTKADYATHIADLLDWEDGIEYNISHGVYSSPNVTLRKEGWVSLYEHLTNND